MNSSSNAMPEFRGGSPAVPVMSATRPMYWSVRRELWENRWIYIAPLVAETLIRTCAPARPYARATSGKWRS